MWNGKIKAIHTTYLDATIKFYVFTTSLNFDDDLKTILPQLWPYAYIIFFPIIELLTLFLMLDKLEDEAIKDRIGQMYVDVNLQRSNAVLFKPFQIIRCGLFVLISVLISIEAI